MQNPQRHGASCLAKQCPSIEFCERRIPSPRSHQHGTGYGPSDERVRRLAGTQQLVFAVGEQYRVSTEQFQGSIPLLATVPGGLERLRIRFDLLGEQQCGAARDPTLDPFWHGRLRRLPWGRRTPAWRSASIDVMRSARSTSASSSPETSFNLPDGEISAAARGRSFSRTVAMSTYAMSILPL